MYTAKIVDKAIVNGLLRVKVQYSNGTDTFNDTIETNQAYDKDWAHIQIRTKLQHLNNFPSLADMLEVGKEITELTAGPKENANVEKHAYKMKLVQFERFVNVLAKGFTTRENKDFVELKKWLTDNFKADYLDLF